MTDAEAEHACTDSHASAPLSSHACAAEPSAAAAAAAATTDTTGATAAVSDGTAAPAVACSSSSSSAAACPQDGESSVYEVNVKCIDGTTTKISVPADIRCVALKELISDKLSVPAERQRLICRGKPLKDDDVLGSYVTQDGQTLHMVQRPARAEAADEHRGSVGGAASSAGASGQAGPPGQDNRVGGPQVDLAHIFGTWLNRGGVPIMARPPIGVPLVRPGMPRPVQASSQMPPPPGAPLIAPGAVPGMPAGLSIGGPPPPPALVPQPAHLAPMPLSQNLTLVAMPAGHVQATPPSPQHAQGATGQLPQPHTTPMYLPVPGSLETRPATAEHSPQGDGSQQTPTRAASPSSATAPNTAPAGSSSHTSSAALLATAASCASSPSSAPGAQGAGPSPVGAPVALGPSLLGTAATHPGVASPPTPVVGFQPPGGLPVAAPAGPPIAPPTAGVGGPAIPGTQSPAVQAAMGTVLVPGMGWPGPPVLPQGLGIAVPPGSVPGPGVPAPPAAAGTLPAGHLPQVFEGQIMGTLLANGAPPGHIPVLPAVFSEALHSAEVIFDAQASWTGASSSRSPSSGSRNRTGDGSLPWRELRRLHQQLARLLGRPGFGPVLAPRPGPDGDMDVFLTTLQNAVGQLGVAISDLQAAHQAGALDQRQRQQFGVAATHAARVLRHTASHFQDSPSRGQTHSRRHEAAVPPSNAGNSGTGMPSAAGAAAPAAGTAAATAVAPSDQPRDSAALGTATGVAAATGSAPAVTDSRSSAEAYMERSLHRQLNTVLEDCAVGTLVPAQDVWDPVASSDSEEVLLPESSPDAASSAAMGAHGTQPASEAGD